MSQPSKEAWDIALAIFRHGRKNARILSPQKHALCELVAGALQQLMDERDHWHERYCKDSATLLARAEVAELSSAALGSQLLDVQQDCIAATKRAGAAEKIAGNALAAQANWRERAVSAELRLIDLVKRLQEWDNEPPSERAESLREILAACPLPQSANYPSED